MDKPTAFPAPPIAEQRPHSYERHGVTIALLVVGGLITLLSRHPMIGLAVIGVGLVAVITLGTRSRDSEDPPPSLPERTEE